MHRYIFTFLCFAVFVFFVAVSTVKAQRHGGYCDAVESTADTLDCVNRHKTDVQDRLNKVYDGLAAEYSSDVRDALDLSQKTWLAYRDAHCGWEAALASNPSLERIYELSCITLLTNMRTEMLSMNQENNSDEEPREFGSQPRWMNVLAHDHPDVFWRYGTWARGDMNCDGKNEQVLAGVEFTKGDNIATAAKTKLVVAISDNPQTGKPRSELLRIDLDDTDSKNGTTLCDTAIDFDFTLPEQPQAEAADSAAEAKICGVKLNVINKGCGSVAIQHTPDGYVLKAADYPVTAAPDDQG